MKFTFKDGIEITYERKDGKHRMIVNNVEGPWLSQYENVLSYEIADRYFIVQTKTGVLPIYFELITPIELKLETIEPSKESSNPH